MSLSYSLNFNNTPSETMSRSKASQPCPVAVSHWPLVPSGESQAPCERLEVGNSLTVEEKILVRKEEEATHREQAYGVVGGVCD
ncbi:hypothetical protein J6590_055774 [Homalodisca vitripennis]|nr:hypothetical protein J6590_055774 [Homalodisca vitripennis]